ncbi:hypothetical protein SG09_73820 [Bradyrhizobium ottawaense]|uniref:Uncharacterized protein n=1 Tax=Bradyrhizobium diazoefficiens TaxID=1355477 RepID=A0A809WZH2_9BRAD|nr:hypothetical protein CF64_35250 [Bradyrhizobium japonicum]BBO08032.1 hypothetical protein SG09_73820 [Bradyrhizobium ottawaense]BBZ92462.1 hypothetical protein F07S3_22950 [Bradyrhizobium diazoefficiens]BCA01586.1 hypothetical protein H12S4_24900 [Bradyrhizobium diazoefficiens]BCA10212.1 hypothetical protein BDHF08_20590 [Bradyrhizobium diazoefficiens]
MAVLAEIARLPTKELGFILIKKQGERGTPIHGTWAAATHDGTEARLCRALFVAREPIFHVDQPGQPGLVAIARDQLTHGRTDSRVMHLQYKLRDDVGSKYRIGIDVENQITG